MTKFFVWAFSLCVLLVPSDSVDLISVQNQIVPLLAAVQKLQKSVLNPSTLTLNEVEKIASDLNINIDGSSQDTSSGPKVQSRLGITIDNFLIQLISQILGLVTGILGQLLTLGD